MPAVAGTVSSRLTRDLVLLSWHGLDDRGVGVAREEMTIVTHLSPWSMEIMVTGTGTVIQRNTGATLDSEFQESILYAS